MKIKMNLSIVPKVLLSTQSYLRPESRLKLWKYLKTTVYVLAQYAIRILTPKECQEASFDLLLERTQNAKT